MVTGTTSIASLTYTNKSGGTEQQEVALPWTLEFQAARGTHAYLSAQNKAATGSVWVAIYVNGKTLKESKSSGPYVIAMANGLIP